MNSDDFFERFFAKLNATPIEPPRDPDSRSAGLIRFFDDLIDMAKSATSCAGIKRDERKQLLTAMRQIMVHRKPLIEFLRASNHPTLDANVLSLLVASYHIGQLANASDTARGLGGRAGGNKQGPRVAARADERWRHHAKQLAIEILAADPRLPITKITDRVMSVCDGVPEYEQVYKYLRKELPSKAERNQKRIKKNSRRARHPAKIQGKHR